MTGVVVFYQSFGDLVRSNPHYHCIILGGGIDDEGCFHNLPIKDTSQLAEVFRRRMIKYLVGFCGIGFFRALGN